MCAAETYTILIVFGYPYSYIVFYNFNQNPKNWVGLTVVNVRAVKNALKLHEDVMQNYFSIGYQLIKIGIYSSAATLKFVIKRL